MVLGETQLSPPRVLATYVTETNFCERALALRRRLAPSPTNPSLPPSLPLSARLFVRSFVHGRPSSILPLETGHRSRDDRRESPRETLVLARARFRGNRNNHLPVRCAFDTRPTGNKRV